MVALIFNLFLGVLILFANLNLGQWIPLSYQSRLICVNQYIKHFSFGNSVQIADTLWIRFLQELDAFNEFKIAQGHLCPDKTSSWHFHIIRTAMDLDPKFIELSLHGPLLISVTISDSVGASILFDKAVASFPNDWRILYRASYQAQIEEKNNIKAADLLYRAGKNGAPAWVMSLAGGLFNESGQRAMAEKIYDELINESKDSETAMRLRLKLDNKIKNYFKGTASEAATTSKSEKDKK